MLDEPSIEKKTPRSNISKLAPGQGHYGGDPSRTASHPFPFVSADLENGWISKEFAAGLESGGGPRRWFLFPKQVPM